MRSQVSLLHSVTQVLIEDLKVLPVLYKNLMDPDYLFADQICTVLSNLSRQANTCKTVFKVLIVHIYSKGSDVSSAYLGAAISTGCVILFFPGSSGGGWSAQAGGNLLYWRLQQACKAQLSGTSAVQLDAASWGQERHGGQGQVRVRSMEKAQHFFNYYCHCCCFLSTIYVCFNDFKDTLSNQLFRITIELESQFCLTFTSMCCRCVIQRLLPFTQYQASAVRRGGIIGTLRNCCFDHSEIHFFSLHISRPNNQTGYIE